MGFIYRLKFKDGKSYIGATTGSVKRRVAFHKMSAKIGKVTLIYKAWRKLGQPQVEIICEAPNESLLEKEIHCIKIFKTVHPYGYNTTNGGLVSPMTIPSVVEKFSKSKIGIRPCQKALDAALKATKGKKRPADVIKRMTAGVLKYWASRTYKQRRHQLRGILEYNKNLKGRKRV